MKKIVSLCIVVMILPLTTSAATVEELTAQINALLQQVQALQQSVGQSSATTPAQTTTGSQCPLISRTLKRASTGDDVARLQQFLARDPSIYPEKQITGYYGALTEAAVKKFQCKNNIVCDGTPESTGYGVVGPRTAALLALQCGGTPSGGTGSVDVGGYMRITPISGGVPLDVTIEVHANTTRSCTGAAYELSYGDGSAPVVLNTPSGTCTEVVQTYTHRYTRTGTFTITLRAGGHTSTAVVTVGGTGGSTSGSDSFTASPVSGSAPLGVSFTGVANATGSCSPYGYSIQFGDGGGANLPVSQCSVSNYSVAHNYSSNGTYTARFYRGSDEVKSVTITVGSGSSSGSTQGGGPFSVSPGYGGDAFAVLASFQLTSSCTAYDIDWGDSSPHGTQSTGSCGSGAVTKELSHTYSGSGSYTITLKRGTGSGQTTDKVGVSVVY